MATFFSSISRLPTFETLLFILSVSFCGTAIKLTLQKRWHVVHQPALVWLVGVGGIVGNDVTYVAAFKHAPPLHVDLISYLWPVLFTLMLGCMPKEKFAARLIFAALLGLYGTFLVMSDGSHIAFQYQYTEGYLLAFSGAILWCIYMLFTQIHTQAPMEMMGMYCGAGALLALVLHSQFEHWVQPTTIEFATMGFIGLASAMGAYFCWDYGSRHGNVRLLTILTYFSPIPSALLLTEAGFGTITPRLGIACILICIASLLSSEGKGFLRRLTHVLLPSFKAK